MKLYPILHRLLSFILFVLIILNDTTGQVLIRLQHRNKPEKTKTLKGNFDYEIKTDDTLYYSRIIGITDSTLSVRTSKYSGRDTAELVHWYGKTRDTIIARKLYVSDTIVIKLQNIVYLKKPWFRNPQIAEPFGWLFATGVLGIAGIPVAAFYHGGKDFPQYLAMEAGIFAVSIPIIFILTRQTKFDMRKKWKFHSEQLN